MGGGLVQLMAYGNQTHYLYPSIVTSCLDKDKDNDKVIHTIPRKHEYHVDDCVKCLNYYKNGRQYNNFTVIEREWYAKGNASFTNNKYLEYVKNVQNRNFLHLFSSQNNSKQQFEIKRDNCEIQLDLTRQIKLAVKLRKMNDEIDKKNKNMMDTR
jgi:hypothetical protein